eukprot:1011679-Pelagomonas_calceolata.AAC.1
MAVPAYKGSLAEAKGACKQTKLVNKCVNWKREQAFWLSSGVPMLKRAPLCNAFTHCVRSGQPIAMR